mmetsp:Transcript_64663/g.208230  ORF Transcript_64663/g.208230 Transcript_64663/m.208230 type:complete len:305 (-) Transcript_64663:1069-1983(-)
MVLADEDRRALKVAVVRFQEQLLKAVPAFGRVRSVHAVLEARLIGGPKVVPRFVPHGLRLPHRVTQGRHLADARVALVVLAMCADAEGERHREVWGRAHNAHLPLSIQHRVQGADQRLAELVRPHGRQELQVWLVYQDHRPQCWVVGPALQAHEAILKVFAVRGLDLAVAVQVGGLAVALHLEVGVVADASNDVQPLRHGLIHEIRMVEAWVIAVEPDCVGTKLPQHAQVVAALGAPQRRCLAGHEVVVWKRPSRQRVPGALQGHRGVADTLQHHWLRACHPLGIRGRGRGYGCGRRRAGRTGG